jgi:hypothetical protein
MVKGHLMKNADDSGFSISLQKEVMIVSMQFDGWQSIIRICFREGLKWHTNFEVRFLTNSQLTQINGRHEFLRFRTLGTLSSVSGIWFVHLEAILHHSSIGLCSEKHISLTNGFSFSVLDAFLIFSTSSNDDSPGPSSVLSAFMLPIRRSHSTKLSFPIRREARNLEGIISPIPNVWRDLKHEKLATVNLLTCFGHLKEVLD